jgi:hypothetical protein
MPDARHTRDGTKGEGNDVQKLHVFALISAAQALRVALNNREVAAMHKDARKYLERAAECARLAEGVEYPELKLYLANLAASWTKVAAETVEAQLPDA